MFFWVFPIFGEKGVFFGFLLDFFNFENCFWITMGIFGGVKEKEKINLTTPYGFKKCFLSFSIFWWKRGLFWIFIGVFQNLKTVLESQWVYLGGSKKRKKSIQPLLVAFKNVFWVFPIFGEKGVFFGFLLDFYEI